MTSRILAVAAIVMLSVGGVDAEYISHEGPAEGICSTGVSARQWLLHPRQRGYVYLSLSPDAGRAPVRRYCVVGDLHLGTDGSVGNVSARAQRWLHVCGDGRAAEHGVPRILPIEGVSDDWSVHLATWLAEMSFDSPLV